MLIHPVWQAANAYFVSLRLEQAPRPDYVRYSFEFWEENSLYSGLAVRAAESSQSGGVGGSSSGQAAYHRVVKGDTLWALARRYGLSLAELIALNPQIKNPNLIYPGNEVRLP